MILMFNRSATHPEYIPWMTGSFKAFIESHKDVQAVYIGTKDKKMLIISCKLDIPKGYDPTSRPWYKSGCGEKCSLLDGYIH